MNEPKSIHANDDWGVVLQSVPSKNKKEIVKRLEEIFGLDKQDAEDILSNMPLILVDNLSFGLSARIKKFFQKIGAVAETTNHAMIKKNCFQVVWPQTPDLSFFMKNETGGSEAPVQEKMSSPQPGEMSPPATIPTLETPFPPKITPEFTEIVSHTPPAFSPEPVPESPEIAPQFSKISENLAPESPEIVSDSHQGNKEKSSVDSDWERRARELNEKLQKIHEEKHAQHARHVEATEKVKNEFQQQLEEEKKKSGEIAKACEDLQKEAEKHEALSREGEEWRSRAGALGEKIRELEASLVQKTSEVEHLTQQKEDLAKQSEKITGETQQELSDLKGRETETQQELSTLRSREAESQQELSTLRSREAEAQQELSTLRRREIEIQQELTDLRGRGAETQQELLTLRNREQEFFRKIEGLERNVQQMTESLRSRDGALAQFEKQIMELAEKAQGYELLRQEHAQLAQERATIRQEYDGKLGEQEIRLAKADEDHRRYRSHVDRKNAAATRELGKWIHGVDGIRQGLQKLVLFLGSDSAVLEDEKKSNLRSPLTRGPNAPNPEKI